MFIEDDNNTCRVENHGENNWRMKNVNDATQPSNGMSNKGMKWISGKFPLLDWRESNKQCKFCKWNIVYLLTLGRQKLG